MNKVIGIVAAMFISGCGEGLETAGNPPLDTISQSNPGLTLGLEKSYVCTAMADFGDSSFRVQHNVYFYQGTVLTVCSVGNSAFETSMTYYYRPNNPNYQTAACSLRFDVDSATYGKWEFVFDQSSRTSHMLYVDNYSTAAILNPIFNCQEA